MTSPTDLPAPYFADPSRRRAALQTIGVAAVFLLFQVGQQVAGSVDTKLEHPLRSVLLSGGVMLLPVLAFSVLDRQWRQSLGLVSLPPARLLGLSAAGVIGGYTLNILGSVLFLVARGGVKDIVASRAGWMQKLSDLPTGAILPLVLFVGLWEELVFRGFLLGRLRALIPVLSGPQGERTRDVLAVVVSALLFGAGHGYQGVLGVLQTTALGLVFGLLVTYARSLWPAVLAHAAIDGFGLFALKVLKPLLEKVSRGELLSGG